MCPIKRTCNFIGNALIVFLNARFCLQLRLQTSNCFCKGLYLRYLCLIRKELLWLNNYPYLNVMLLSECFIKTIHSPLLEETLIVLLPLLLVKFCIIDASQADSLLWAKMTVLKVFEKEEKTILVEKSAAATAVAEIMDEETAYPVIDGLFHTRIKIE